MVNKMIKDIVTFDNIFSKNMEAIDSFSFDNCFQKTFNNDFDMYEEEGNLVLEIPVAGFRKEEIFLSIKNFSNYDKILVSCSKKEKEENKNKKFYNKITNNQSISKTISLPFKIDCKNVKATVENGILKVTTIKQTKTEDNQIKIHID